MPKKKAVPKPTKQPALTKQDMVDYIGPVFEDFTSRIDTKTHRLEVMMDATKREILSALETFSAASAKETTVKDHEARISDLETDMHGVKTVLRTSKIQN